VCWWTMKRLRWSLSTTMKPSLWCWRCKHETGGKNRKNSAITEKKKLNLQQKWKKTTLILHYRAYKPSLLYLAIKLIMISQKLEPYLIYLFKNGEIPIANRCFEIQAIDNTCSNVFFEITYASTYMYIIFLCFNFFAICHYYAIKYVRFE
jgi:hypothetical protein